jgi:hypothetical protein
MYRSLQLLEAHVRAALGVVDGANQDVDQPLIVCIQAQKKSKTRVVNLGDNGTHEGVPDIKCQASWPTLKL